MFQDIADTLSKFRSEVLEDEVRILFRYCRRLVIGNIMPKCDIVQGEVDCRSVGEMGNDHSVYKGDKILEITPRWTRWKINGPGTPRCS